jgi:hypothetical protein
MTDFLCQRLALDQFHDQEMPAVGLLHAEERGDVVVVEGGQHLGFTLEPRDALRIGRHGVVQDFHRDVAPELRVARAVDLAHPAGAGEGDDFVQAERNPAFRATLG